MGGGANQPVNNDCKYDRLYNNINSAGDAIDFGDLTEARRNGGQMLTGSIENSWHFCRWKFTSNVLQIQLNL